MWVKKGRTTPLYPTSAEGRGMTVAFYLPADLPDLNPIAQAFEKLKAFLRKAAARTVEDLWQAIADSLDQFTPDECANYLRNAGYASNQS